MSETIRCITGTLFMSFVCSSVYADEPRDEINLRGEIVAVLETEPLGLEIRDGKNSFRVQLTDDTVIREGDNIFDASVLAEGVEIIVRGYKVPRSKLTYAEIITVETRHR